MLTDTPLCVADVVTKATDLIEPEGAWLQGVYSNGGKFVGGEIQEIARATCFCVEGAIAHVLGASGEYAENWCDDNLAPLLGLKGPGAVAQWNDDATDKAEVVAALRRAATLARAGDA